MWGKELSACKGQVACLWMLRFVVRCVQTETHSLNSLLWFKNSPAVTVFGKQPIKNLAEKEVHGANGEYEQFCI
jgi:hypothetical protein